MWISDIARSELRRRGFTIPSVVNTRQLHPESRFCAPMFFDGITYSHSRINIGAFSLINGGRIQNCSIGRYCSIAPSVSIAPAGHPMDRLTTTPLTFDINLYGWNEYLKSIGLVQECEILPFHSAQPEVTIGNDVWIGENAFIKAGVKIGNSCIIAAHACVVHDVEDFAIVAGVPARKIKLRYNELQRERISKIKWWNYSITNIPGLSFENINKTLDYLEGFLDSAKIYPDQTIIGGDIHQICEDADNAAGIN